MYNKRKPEGTDVYRYLDMEIPEAYGDIVTDKLWTAQEEDDASWLTVVRNQPS